jgi:hypothetical protein
MKRVLMFLAVASISAVCAVAQVGVIHKGPLLFSGIPADVSPKAEVADALVASAAGYWTGYWTWTGKTWVWTWVWVSNSGGWSIS